MLTARNTRLDLASPTLFQRDAGSLSAQIYVLPDAFLLQYLAGGGRLQACRAEAATQTPMTP